MANDVQVRKPDVPMENGRLQPQSLEQLWRLCEMVARSGMAPKDMQRPEQLMVASQMGMGLGLDFFQSIQNIAVINGRPSIWGDAMLGTVRSSGTLEAFEESFEGQGENLKAVCKARRKGQEDWIVNEFSVADAKTAKLWGKPGPWQTNPKRMLKMRARAFTLRDGWADFLKGMHGVEELIGEADAPKRERPAKRIETPTEPVEYRVEAYPDIEAAEITPSEGPVEQAADETDSSLRSSDEYKALQEAKAALGDEVYREAKKALDISRVDTPEQAAAIERKMGEIMDEEG